MRTFPPYHLHAYSSIAVPSPDFEPHQRLSCTAPQSSKCQSSVPSSSHPFPPRFPTSSPPSPLRRLQACGAMRSQGCCTTAGPAQGRDSHPWATSPPMQPWPPGCRQRRRRSCCAGLQGQRPCARSSQQARTPSVQRQRSRPGRTLSASSPLLNYSWCAPPRHTCCDPQYIALPVVFVGH